jgi:hypothetical protein
MSGGFTGTDPDKGPLVLPSTNSRELFELRRAGGTQFGRVFDFPYFGLDKLAHDRALVHTSTSAGRSGDLPVFDGVDHIEPRSLFTYGMATRLLGRSAPENEGERGEVFELVRLSATQSYDFIRTIPPTSSINAVTGLPGNPSLGDHFSDIDFALRVNPSPVTSVRAYATYDTSENDLSSATVGIRLRQPHVSR